MSLDSFDDLAERAECPPPDIYTAVLRAQHKLHREHPDGISFDAIGIEAWNGLTPEQRFEALPTVLRYYAIRVNDEEHARKLADDATDTATSYLEPADVPTLWDSILCAEVDPVEADRFALIHVLSELELLQHRLAMRDAERET